MENSKFESYASRAIPHSSAKSSKKTSMYLISYLANITTPNDKVPVKKEEIQNQD